MGVDMSVHLQAFEIRTQPAVLTTENNAANDGVSSALGGGTAFSAGYDFEEPGNFR